MSHRPTFSVIVPVHNGVETIGQTLASLQAQTFPDWEALIIDDASSDGSVALVAAFCAKDRRFRQIHDPSQTMARGPSATRNIGIEHAAGDYIAFLDADDQWLPPKLEQQARAFAAGAQIVFSSYQRIGQGGQILGTVSARPHVCWKDALYGNPIGCLTGAYRRQRFPDARMPQRDFCEDYAFWLNLLRSGEEAVGLPDILATYLVRPGSRSSRKRQSAQAVWDILKDQKIGMIQRIAGFTGYAAKATFELAMSRIRRSVRAAPSKRAQRD